MRKTENYIINLLKHVQIYLLNIKLIKHICYLKQTILSKQNKLKTIIQMNVFTVLFPISLLINYLYFNTLLIY